jgi:hypothetical protein
MADQNKGPNQGGNPGKGAQSGPQSSTPAGSQGGYSTGTGADAKKPSAIIDLKATVIETKDAKPTTSSATAGAGAKPSEQAKPDTTKPAASTAATSSVPKTGGATSAQTTSTAQTASTAKVEPIRATTKPTALPAAASSKSGGFGALISHATAGMLGGFLALLGADTLGQSIGLGRAPAGTGGNSTALEQRLAVLEQSTKAGGGPVTGDAGAKLAAAEARLAKLEELSRALPALTETQTRLTAETKALAAKVDTPLGADPAARLAKLEETFATLSAVAAKDPQPGRIPQLAQLSGKIADLEAALSTQLAATRKTITAELDNRLGQSAETSEAAKSGTVRIDRDLATVKTEAARTAQAVETLGATLKSVQAETGTLKATVDEIGTQLKSVARPQDVAAALAPMTSKLSGLEQNVQGVVKNEDDRRTQSERMVLALELGNLKRALDRGGAYAAELADVEKTSGGKLNLAGLAKYKDQGVPTVASLTGDFRSVAHSVIAADAEPASGSVIDRLLASAKGVVRVRKVAAGTEDKSAEAIVARIEAALKSGRLSDIAAEAQPLSPRAKAVIDPWLSKVDVRGGIDRAVGEIETQLKASLSGKAPEKVKQ